MKKQFFIEETVIEFDDDNYCQITHLNEDGTFITKSDGWCFYLDPKWNVTPQVGDNIFAFTKNGEVRGVLLNDVLLFYKTDEELEAEHLAWLEENSARKLKEFEENKEKMDAQYEALPDVFKKRIDKFRSNNPTFRIDYERYEVFCCEQAIHIAEACKTEEEINRFYSLGFKERQLICPQLSDDHSGNTFGASCFLAKTYLVDKENLVNVRGALSSLVGSEEYGD